MKTNFLRSVFASLLIALCFITYAVPKTKAAPVDDKTSITNIVTPETATPAIDLTAVTTVREQEYTATGIEPTSTAELPQNVTLPDIDAPTEDHSTLHGRPPSQ